jgi:hypothetical protein
MFAFLIFHGGISEATNDRDNDQTEMGNAKNLICS